MLLFSVESVQRLAMRELNAVAIGISEQTPVADSSARIVGPDFEPALGIGSPRDRVDLLTRLALKAEVINTIANLSFQ